jgi:hypothetical protein
MQQEIKICLPHGFLAVGFFFGKTRGVLTRAGGLAFLFLELVPGYAAGLLLSGRLGPRAELMRFLIDCPSNLLQAFFTSLVSVLITKDCSFGK